MRARGILLALLLAGCSGESSRVREARNQFYEALTRFDQSEVRARVSPDYLSVDHGRIFGLDSLLADLSLLERESLTVRYTFLDSAVRVDPPE